MATPPSPRSLFQEWALLARLRASQRPGGTRGPRRWLFLAGCLPAVITGYVVLALMVAAVLPSPALPATAVLGLAAAAVLGRAVARGLETGGPALPRGGLTQLLASPVRPRALVVQWLGTELLAAVVAIAGVFAWMGVVVFGEWGALEHLAGLLAGTVGLAAAGVGLRTAFGLWATRMPAPARSGGIALVRAGVAVCAVLAAAAMLGAAWTATPPASWPTPLAGALTTARTAGAAAGAPFAAAMATPGIGWALVTAPATGLLCLAIAAGLAPLAEGLDLMLAAEEEADRRTPGGAAVRRRRGWRWSYGRGAAALVWKVTAERAAGATGVPPALGWVALLAAGVAVAWVFGAQAPMAPAAVVAAVVLAGAPAGGRGTPGLAAELGHPAWLLRLPGPPARLLAALLLPPVLRLVVMAALLSLPLAVSSGALGVTCMALGCGGVLLVAAHLGRAVCWLSQPPWMGSDAEAAVAEVRALAMPPGVGVATAAVVWLGFGVSPYLACLAAAAPAAGLIAARWREALRLWDGLELVPARLAEAAGAP